MASFSVLGTIESIRFLPNGGGALIFLTEYKRGYKRSNGERVEDRYLSWCCIYNANMAKYISSHFGRGMYVEIKGEILPYAKENGESKEGYSVLAQTLNMASYPKPFFKKEKQLMKETQSNLEEDEKPNAKAFLSDDF